jgi:hypothetical protein
VSNRDGRANVADAIVILRFMLAKGAPLPCLDAADADDSGRIDIGDVLHLLNYLFCNRAPPPCPGPTVEGFDPTPDDLACE